ncbi:MAG: hypothetical protein NC548_11225 [Lachnospiraceae bacterium]|nr:hypothetical protein [Lachnospiraceae bacterium]MCM1235619.1 hypothetical protein [Ruminococcus flavefaciens]
MVGIELLTYLREFGSFSNDGTVIDLCGNSVNVRTLMRGFSIDLREDPTLKSADHLVSEDSVISTYLDTAELDVVGSVAFLMLMDSKYRLPRDLGSSLVVKRIKSLPYVCRLEYNVDDELCIGYYAPCVERLFWFRENMGSTQATRLLQALINLRAEAASYSPMIMAIPIVTNLLEIQLPLHGDISMQRFFIEQYKAASAITNLFTTHVTNKQVNAKIRDCLKRWVPVKFSNHALFYDHDKMVVLSKVDDSIVWCRNCTVDVDKGLVSAPAIEDLDNIRNGMYQSDKNVDEQLLNYLHSRYPNNPADVIALEVKRLCSLVCGDELDSKLCEVLKDLGD